MRNSIRFSFSKCIEMWMSVVMRLFVLLTFVHPVGNAILYDTRNRIVCHTIDGSRPWSMFIVDVEFVHHNYGMAVWCELCVLQKWPFRIVDAWWQRITLAMEENRRTKIEIYFFTFTFIRFFSLECDFFNSQLHDFLCWNSRMFSTFSQKMHANWILFAVETSLPFCDAAIHLHKIIHLNCAQQRASGGVHCTRLLGQWNVKLKNIFAMSWSAARSFRNSIKIKKREKRKAFQKFRWSSFSSESYQTIVEIYMLPLLLTWTPQQRFQFTIKLSRRRDFIHFTCFVRFDRATQFGFRRQNKELKTFNCVFSRNLFWCHKLIKCQSRAEKLFADENWLITVRSSRSITDSSSIEGDLLANANTFSRCPWSSACDKRWISSPLNRRLKTKSRLINQIRRLCACLKWISGACDVLTTIQL